MDEYQKIKKQKDKGEIVPFYILKNFIDYKMNNNIELDKLIKFYRISDPISFKYLSSMDPKKDYANFLSEFNRLKFSLSDNNLKNVSKKLDLIDYNQQKEFISLKPNKMFLRIFNEIKRIFAQKRDITIIKKELTDLLIKFNKIYNSINEMVLFPTLIASDNYCYNKLLFDFIYCINQFLQKRINYQDKYLKKDESVNSDKSNSDFKDNEIKNQKKKIKDNPKIQSDVERGDEISESENILNKKRRRSSSSESDNQEFKYVEYESDDEFFESFKKLIKFMNFFEEIFNLISKEENHQENILKIQIFLFYLYCYEEQRKPYDKIALKNICDVLATSTINEEILNRCEISDTTGKKITKDEWKNVKNEQKVNVKINKEIIENVKIKYFNTKILSLDDDNLKEILKIKDNDYDIKYLSIYGYKVNSTLYKSPEIEKIIKQYLFDLISSNIIKEGFQKFDLRFDHNKQIYPFQGFYKNEIFDEIWNNIIPVPFIYKYTCAKTERTDYKIFLDLMPSDDITNPQKINILFTKLNDLYHEIFHIISILYAANAEEYKDDEYGTLDLFYYGKSNEIMDIINKYANEYSSEVQIEYELTDMGDIMEIYLFGIKPREINLYAFIYFSFLFDMHLIESLTNIEDIRSKISKLYSNKDGILIKKIEEYNSNNNDEKNELYNYFKNSNIFNLCKESFSTLKVLYNFKYSRRLTNSNKIITNISYNYFRRTCYPRKDKKIKKLV